MQNKMKIGRLPMIVIIAAAGYCQAENNATTAIGQWDDPAIWSAGVPTAGQDVTVGHNVTLADSTADLASCMITNGATLTFTNWTTCLQATNVTLSGNATVTHAPCDTNTVVSNTNRVYILCTSLRIDSGSAINADAMGYRGASGTVTNENGQGPGGAPYPGKEAGGGGGYGGKGSGGKYFAAASGPAYGEASFPVQPGSGGGQSYEGSASGGHGGGAIWIEVTGTVTLEGAIRANGGNPELYTTKRAGGGSGGGIYLSCHTITGSGRIEAMGGYGGLYNATLVHLRTNGGGGGGGRIAVLVNRTAQLAGPKANIGISTAGGALYKNPEWYKGDVGSLYLNAPEILPTSISDELSVEGFNTWSMDSLTLDNSAALYVRGGLATDFMNDYTLLDIKGSFAITSNAVFYPVSDATNGGSVLVRCASFELGSNAMINAEGLGFRGNKADRADARPDGYGLGVTPPAATGHSFGLGGEAGSGGGYGGKGGPGRAKSGLWDDWGQQLYWPGGVTWGSSNAPVFPGSSGGGDINNNLVGGSGGGLVRMEITRLCTLDGIINANGLRPEGRTGGGSGGGVYIQCGTLAGSGIISANGGDAHPYNGRYSGAGGGGRIAMLRNKDISLITYSMKGGTNAATNHALYRGEEGTLYQFITPPAATIISIR